ncbi:MAG: transcription-repair coupling factor, partial [Marmoricola sp.]|nr:transcription-repair coupling factor [Marmoricola sp.]
MSTAALADLVLRNPTLAGAMADARDGVPVHDLTGPAALRPFVVKGLVDAGRTVLVVAATVREAEDLTEELQDVVDPHSVVLYPAWETLPHERLSPRSDTVGRRL